MSLPAIDFRVLRPHHGSQHSGFEELVCQLAALETPAGIPFFRKGAGADAGLECYRVEGDGSETGWQAKYFFDLGSGQASQLTDSFIQAVERHPRLARFIACLPFNLSDGRIEGRTSERDRWDAWVKARTDAIKPRIVAIELWDETQLIERLSRIDPRHAGRRQYWFDVLHFTPAWFRTRFEITRAALGKRYTPELNIELPVRRGLLAIARDPAFIESLLALADNVDEVRHLATNSMTRLLASGPTSEAAATLDAQLHAISTLIRKAPMGPAETIPFDAWGQALDHARATLSTCAAAIWSLRAQPDGNREEVKSADHHADRLYESLDTLSKAINTPASRLTNEYCLLITGEAGVGKSHLPPTSPIITFPKAFPQCSFSVEVLSMAIRGAKSPISSGSLT